MKELIKAKKKYLVVCIIVSILFVAGILMTVLGLVNSIPYIWIPGIVFTASGFYGAPILWTMLPIYTEKISVGRNIESGIYSFEQISKNTGIKLKEINKIVNSLINSYLFGYSVNEKNDGVLPSEKIIARANGIYCKFCGAKIKYDDQKCNNCGALITD
jgi:hypothetical protein